MTQTQLQKLVQIKSLRDNKEILIDYDKQESFDKILDELIEFEKKTEIIYKRVEDSVNIMKILFLEELNNTVYFDTHKGIVGIESTAERCTVLVAEVLCKLENLRESNKDSEKEYTSTEIAMIQNFTNWKPVNKN